MLTIDKGPTTVVSVQSTQNSIKNIITSSSHDHIICTVPQNEFLRVRPKFPAEGSGFQWKRVLSQGCCGQMSRTGPRRVGEDMYHINQECFLIAPGQHSSAPGHCVCPAAELCLSGSRVGLSGQGCIAHTGDLDLQVAQGIGGLLHPFAASVPLFGSFFAVQQ